MGDLTIKLRASTVPGRPGTLFFRVVHNRRQKEFATPYKLYPDEWDTGRMLPVWTAGSLRKDYLMYVRHALDTDSRRLWALIRFYPEVPGGCYSARHVVSAFCGDERCTSFVTYGRGVAERLWRQGRVRTGEIYVTALNSFLRFSAGRDYRTEDIDADVMQRFERYLRSRRLMMNTTSFYMRALRALYNAAVEKRLTAQRYPFKRVYTGIGRTQKRALPLTAIRQIKELDLPETGRLDWARDLFLFSFYTRGMAFVDMAFLRKTDLSEGVLSYRRRKTGQSLRIKWEPCMQRIVEKYACPGSPFLLPIIRREGSDERRQYLNALLLVNRRLKDVARRMGLPLALTMYVARHSWASIARTRHIPLSVISESMGHDSERTTAIYLASLDAREIDRANGRILDLLEG